MITDRFRQSKGGLTALALIVGAGSGAAAVVFRWLIVHATRVFTGSADYSASNGHPAHPLHALVPTPPAHPAARPPGGPSVGPSVGGGRRPHPGHRFGRYLPGGRAGERDDVGEPV